MDDDERSKGPTPERDNVKTLPRRGLADLRKRMTDACIARVRRYSRPPRVVVLAATLARARTPARPRHGTANRSALLTMRHLRV